MNSFKDIRYGKHMHSNINRTDVRLIIHDQIRKVESEWKGEKISETMMVKSSHKLFKVVVKELNK